jgi:hypothetical protein
MIGNHPKPARDPRFGELDILIAEQNLIADQSRHQKNQKTNPPLLTEAEQAQRVIERAARLKRETRERLEARKELLVAGVRRI